MKNEIIRILAHQCDPSKISFEEKNGDTLVNLPCYAITGFAVRDLFNWSQANGKTCVVTIQAVDNPHLQIIL